MRPRDGFNDLLEKMYLFILLVLVQNIPQEDISSAIYKKENKTKQNNKLYRNVKLTFIIQIRASFSHYINFFFLYFTEHLHLNTSSSNQYNSPIRHIYAVLPSPQIFRRWRLKADCRYLDLETKM